MTKGIIGIVAGASLTLLLAGCGGLSSNGAGSAQSLDLPSVIGQGNGSKAVTILGTPLQTGLPTSFSLDVDNSGNVFTSTSGFSPSAVGSSCIVFPSGDYVSNSSSQALLSFTYFKPHANAGAYVTGSLGSPGAINCISISKSTGQLWIGNSAENYGLPYAKPAIPSGISIVTFGSSVTSPASRIVLGSSSATAPHDGTGLTAGIEPSFIAARDHEAVFIDHNTIRLVKSDGVHFSSPGSYTVTTLFHESDMPGPSLAVGGFSGVCALPNGHFAVSDLQHATIFVISDTGQVIHTYTGPTATDVDGVAGAGSISTPVSIACNASGTIYFTDNSKLRMLTPDGTISTVVGKASGAATGTRLGNDYIWPASPVSGFQESQPAIAVAPTGEVYGDGVIASANLGSHN